MQEHAFDEDADRVGVGGDTVDDGATGVGVEEAETQLLKLGEDLGTEVNHDAPVHEMYRDEAKDVGEGSAQESDDDDAA